MCAGWHLCLLEECALSNVRSSIAHRAKRDWIVKSMRPMDMAAHAPAKTTISTMRRAPDLCLCTRWNSSCTNNRSTGSHSTACNQEAVRLERHSFRMAGFGVTPSLSCVDIKYTCFWIPGRGAYQSNESRTGVRACARLS